MWNFRHQRDVHVDHRVPRSLPCARFLTGPRMELLGDRATHDLADSNEAFARPLGEMSMSQTAYWPCPPGLLRSGRGPWRAADRLAERDLRRVV